MEVCKEMQILRDWLDKNKIEWEDASEDTSEDFDEDKKYSFWMCRTWFRINGKRISVVNGYGSYGGGVDFLGGENEGLLETMGLIGDDVIGHMTAGEVIIAIKILFYGEKKDAKS